MSDEKFHKICGSCHSLVPMDKGHCPYCGSYLLKTKKGNPSEELVRKTAAKEKNCENGAPFSSAFKGIGVMLAIGGGLLLLTIISSAFNQEGSQDDFNAESFKSSFLYSCKKNASDKYCNCVLSEVEKNYTTEQLKIEAKNLSENNKASDKLNEQMYKCQVGN